LHGGGGPPKENPGQQIVALPDALGVGADYGLTVMEPSLARRVPVRAVLLSTEGQGLLAKHGFASPGL